MQQLRWCTYELQLLIPVPRVCVLVPFVVGEGGVMIGGVRIDLCLYIVCIIIIIYMMIVNNMNDEVVKINVTLMNALK